MKSEVDLYAELNRCIRDIVKLSQGPKGWWPRVLALRERAGVLAWVLDEDLTIYSSSLVVREGL